MDTWLRWSEIAIECSIGEVVVVLAIMTVMILLLLLARFEQANQFEKVELRNKALAEENFKLIQELEDLKKANRKKPT